MSEFFRDLLANGRLNVGDDMYSATRAFRLNVQADGNLVLYVIDDTTLPRDRIEGPDVNYIPIWGTDTNGTDVNHCVMQTDGNLVLLNAANVPRWGSGTQGHPNAFLRCQSDGNLVIYTVDGRPIWASNTNAGVR